MLKTKELRSFGVFFQKKDYHNIIMYEVQPSYGGMQFGQGNFYNINSNPLQYPNSFFFHWIN